MFSSLALLLAAVLAVSAQNVWTPTAATLLIGNAQTGNYDDTTAWDNGEHCSGSFMVGTGNLGDYLKQNFAGISSVGGYSCRPNTANTAKMSVHGTGRAIDVMIPIVAGDANNKVGDPIAKYLVENAQRLGVQYFIWDRKSWSLSSPAGKKFNTYTGPNPHIDHLHVELTIAAASRVGFLPVVTAVPTAKPSDPQCIAKAGTCTSTCTGGGTFVSNLCPSFGAAIKCCVKATTPAPLTSTIHTYISPFKGPSATSTKCTTPISKRVGACLFTNDCPGATFNGLCPGNSKCCVADVDKSGMTIPAVYDVAVIPRTLFTKAFGGITGLRADAMYAFLSKALKDGGITSCLCKAAFMAQVGHESGGLAYFEEIASGADYEGRKDLGNVQTGDGVRYKGRGPIQLTGRANYKAASARLKVDVEADPELVCMPSMGFRTTVDYWNTNNLNTYCVNGGAAEFITMTKFITINGGTKGLDDREARYAANRKSMGC